VSAEKTGISSVLLSVSVAVREYYLSRSGAASVSLELEDASELTLVRAESPTTYHGVRGSMRTPSPPHESVPRAQVLQERSDLIR
jgi:hypothetical protein